MNTRQRVERIEDECDGVWSQYGVTSWERNFLESVKERYRQIKGYRELNAEEIALMNEIKSKGAELGELVAKLRAVPDLDQRWVSIGATDLQTGLMALTRGVARPTFF